MDDDLAARLSSIERTLTQMEVDLAVQKTTLSMITRAAIPVVSATVSLLIGIIVGLAMR